VTRRQIAFYAFIHHFPETDERKEHKHVFIMPNGLINTDNLLDVLQEFEAVDKPPLGCMPFRSSKWGDWYLYSIHDTAYLATKSQARKYHYTEKDIVSSDTDYLLDLIHTIDFAKYRKTADFVTRIEQGVPFLEMVKSGQIPAPQFNQWLALYEYIQNRGLERNGNATHTPSIDPLTGEVLSDEVSQG